MLNFRNTTYGCIALLLIAILLWKEYQLYYPFLVVLLLYIGTLSWGAFDLRLNFFMHSTCDRKTSTNQIAITFDDGPSPYTLEILGLLDQYGVKASFFCIGSQVLKYPEIAKQIVMQGHVIANHSMNHPNSIGFFCSDSVAVEMKHANQAIEKITGKKTLLYRPPFGVSNPHIAKALDYCAMTSIGWSIRSLDTLNRDENKIFKRIKKRLRPGKIILLHDTSQKTVHVVKSLLIELQTNKLEALNLEDFLNQKVYEN